MAAQAGPTSSTGQKSASPAGSASKKREVMSLLPLHNFSTPSSPTSQRTARRGINPNENLEEKFDKADLKLLRLEEELDVLLHCACLLREKRTTLTLNRLKYTHDTPNIPVLDGSDELIDDYLALAAKTKAIDETIKALKEECGAARSDCNYLLNKIRTPSAKLRQALRNKDSLAHGRPESGFTDRTAVAERIMVAESTATSVAGVVGAFGAGITYTTIFSASRGRLDLISWAFTCFLIVVVDCAALQMFALPRHGQLAKIFRMEYSGSAENRLLVYILLIGIPMLTGFLLLGVSVALLDGRALQPDPGSEIATRAAGYLPVAFLGYFVILILLTALCAVIIRLLPRRFLPGAKHMPLEHGRLYASFIFPLKDKLYFLPGGPGYEVYRQKRILGRKPYADGTNLAV